MSLFYAKHYKAIAYAVNGSRLPREPESINAYWLVSLLSFMFRLDNPRFDAEAFRVACGEKPEHNASPPKAY